MLLLQFERQVIAGKKLNRTWKKNFSGDMFLFVSSKRRRLEARNFTVILISRPFTAYEEISFTE